MFPDEWIEAKIAELEAEKAELLPQTEEILKAHKRVMKINTILEWLRSQDG